MPKTRCPNCDSVISMNKPREGAVIICPHCGVELEVIRTDPSRWISPMIGRRTGKRSEYFSGLCAVEGTDKALGTSPLQRGAFWCPFCAISAFLLDN